MYSIIEVGGKQLRVSKDQIIKVEKMPFGDDNKVVFSEVLAIEDESGVQLGKPILDGYKVIGEVIKEQKDDKVIIFKKKRRHNYRRKNGHRQMSLIVRVTDIISKEV